MPGRGCLQLAVETPGIHVPYAPRAGEDFVGGAAEQQRIGAALPLADQRVDLIAAVFGVVVRCPVGVLEAASGVFFRVAARLDDAVEGDERLHHDPAHCDPP